MERLRRALGSGRAATKKTFPSVVITIREIAYKWCFRGEGTARAKWKVSVHGPDFCNVICFEDPYDAAREDRLRWFLEDFPKVHSLEFSKADEVSKSLKSYAEGLISDLSLEEAFRNIPLGTSCVYLDIEAHDELRDTTPSLHKIHWETLQFRDVWGGGKEPKFGGTRMVVVRRKLLLENRTLAIESPPPDDSFNILLVVARKPVHQNAPTEEGEVSLRLEEVGHRDLSLLTVNALRKLPQNRAVHLEIVRPGTWTAFERHLQSRPKGFFSLIQFDVHGRKTEPSLLFLSSDGKSLDWVFSDNVAKLLKTFCVPAVILNACNSAADGRGVALTFIEHGIPAVVAMSYEILVDAAVLFVNTFYLSLIVKQETMAIAAYRGRDALLQFPVRHGSHNAMVTLCDFIVPVLYSCGVERQTRVNHLWSNSKSPIFHNYGFLPARLIGRDSDILTLESKLLSGNGTLCMTGKRGVGKTSVLRHLRWWWKVTSLIEDSHYLDLRKFHNTKTLPLLLVILYRRLLRWPGVELRKLLEMRERFPPEYPKETRIYKEVVECLQKDRHLLIIDGIENWEPQSCLSLRLEDRLIYIATQKQFLAEFLKELEGGRSLVLVASPTFLSLHPLSHHMEEFELKGLQREDMRNLLPAHYLPANPPSPELFAWHDRFLDLLDGVPQTLECFQLPLQVDPTDIWHYLHINNQVSVESGQTLPRFTDDSLTSDIPDLAASAIELVFILAPFWVRLPIHIDHYLLLLSFFGAVPEELRLPEHQGLLPANISREQIKNMQIDSVKTKDLMAGSRLKSQFELLIAGLKHHLVLGPDTGGKKDDYYIINPAFTLRMREMVYGPKPSVSYSRSKTITLSFSTYYAVRSAGWSENILRQSKQNPCILERENLYSLMLTSFHSNSLLSNFCSQQISQGLTPIWSYDPDVWHIYFPALVLMQLYPSARADGDVLPISLLCKSLIAEFDALHEAKKENFQPVKYSGTFMLAYMASNWLSIYYKSRLIYDKFIAQSKKSDLYSELARCLDAKKHPWRIAADYCAAQASLEAAQLAIEGDDSISMPNFGRNCRRNRLALQLAETDPRFQIPAESDDPMALPLHLHNLQLKLWREDNKTHSDSSKIECLRKDIEECCERILQEAGEPLAPELDAWIRNEKAAAGLTSASRAKTAFTHMEFQKHPHANGLLEDAAEAIGRKAFPDAKDKARIALLHAQHTENPASQFICHQVLALLAQLTQKWEDAIWHLLEMGKLAEPCLADKQEIERQFAQAVIWGMLAVCYIHIEHLEEAIHFVSRALETFRLQAKDRTDDKGFNNLYFGTLVLLQWLATQPGCVSLNLNEDAIRLERLHISGLALPAEIQALSKDALRHMEDFIAAYLFATIMTSRAAAMAAQAQFYTNLPTYKMENGSEVPLYTLQRNTDFWEGQNPDVKDIVKEWTCWFERFGAGKDGWIVPSESEAMAMLDLAES